MKTIHQYIFFLLIPLLFASCNKDGDTVILTDTQLKGTISISDSVVILTNATKADTTISIKWSIEGLSINDTSKYGIAKTVRTNTLQFDTLETFTNPKETVESNTLKSFIGKDLNSFALSMGLKPDVARTIYVRLKSSIGANMEAMYSNVASFSVKPYDVTSYLYMPGLLGWNNYSVKLCSSGSTGKYEGYVQAAIWDKFKFTDQADGSGIWYGPSKTLGVYVLDATSDWNIWFDEAGYFLVKANTNDMTWSKTLISSFSITGDFNSWSTTANPMTYNATTKLWTATCNFQPGEWGNTFKIIANNDWVIVYGDNSANGTLKEGEKITVTSAGMHTVTMDLSNPLKYTYTIQ